MFHKFHNILLLILFLAVILPAMGNTIESFASQEEDLTQIFKSNYGLGNFDPFHYANTLSEPTSIEDIYGEFNENLEYICGNYVLEEVDVLVPQDILYDAVYLNLDYLAQEKDFYFYHGDHLGSANWITDIQGLPIQYIHYAPYGELIANQSAAGYDERYKFTGKERDADPL